MNLKKARVTLIVEFDEDNDRPYDWDWDEILGVKAWCEDEEILEE
jgi:hypothetical protein|tara:strand:+ start:2577 stop:2711 length:135 start_codon:yes stop_codon:yes gene_type:complete